MNKIDKDPVHTLSVIKNNNPGIINFILNYEKIILDNWDKLSDNKIIIDEFNSYKRKIIYLICEYYNLIINKYDICSICCDDAKKIEISKLNNQKKPHILLANHFNYKKIDKLQNNSGTYYKIGKLEKK